MPITATLAPLSSVPLSSVPPFANAPRVVGGVRALVPSGDRLRESERTGTPAFAGRITRRPRLPARLDAGRFCSHDA